ncbi:hypothetical protein ETB92_05275 [Lactobacillus delbrueckii subsp. bulgaricus]|nr:hypothetical protein CYJ84_03740 [Lactobacillus delbrueckii]RXS48057.1 hypothetical protein ETB92_05275 [Lactobacillus delbrueckii subsp. bulgaricus]
MSSGSSLTTRWRREDEKTRRREDEKTRRREDEKTRSKKSAPGPVLIFYMLNFYSNHQPARFSVEAA